MISDPRTTGEWGNHREAEHNRPQDNDAQDTGFDDSYYDFGYSDYADEHDGVLFNHGNDDADEPDTEEVNLHIDVSPSTSFLNRSHFIILSCIVSQNVAENYYDYYEEQSGISLVSKPSVRGTIPSRDIRSAVKLDETTSERYPFICRSDSGDRSKPCASWKREHPCAPGDDAR